MRREGSDSPIHCLLSLFAQMPRISQWIVWSCTARFGEKPKLCFHLSCASELTSWSARQNTHLFFVWVFKTALSSKRGKTFQKVFWGCGALVRKNISCCRHILTLPYHLFGCSVSEFNILQLNFERQTFGVNCVLLLKNLVRQDWRA